MALLNSTIEISYLYLGIFALWCIAAGFACGLFFEVEEEEDNMLERAVSSEANAQIQHELDRQEEK